MAVMGERELALSMMDYALRSLGSLKPGLGWWSRPSGHHFRRPITKRTRDDWARLRNDEDDITCQAWQMIKMTSSRAGKGTMGRASGSSRRGTRSPVSKRCAAPGRAGRRARRRSRGGARVRIRAEGLAGLLGDLRHQVRGGQHDEQRRDPPSAARSLCASQSASSAEAGASASPPLTAASWRPLRCRSPMAVSLRPGRGRSRTGAWRWQRMLNGGRLNTSVAYLTLGDRYGPPDGMAVPPCPLFER